MNNTLTLNVTFDIDGNASALRDFLAQQVELAIHHLRDAGQLTPTDDEATIVRLAAVGWDPVSSADGDYAFRVERCDIQLGDVDDTWAVVRTDLAAEAEEDDPEMETEDYEETLAVVQTEFMADRVMDMMTGGARAQPAGIGGIGESAYRCLDLSILHLHPQDHEVLADAAEDQEDNRVMGRATGFFIKLSRDKALRRDNFSVALNAILQWAYEKGYSLVEFDQDNLSTLRIFPVFDPEVLHGA